MNSKTIWTRASLILLVTALCSGFYLDLERAGANKNQYNLR